MQVICQDKLRGGGGCFQCNTFLVGGGSTQTGRAGIQNVPGMKNKYFCIAPSTVSGLSVV